MIIDILPLLREKRIVLASQSPRRREILDLMGLTFEIKVSSFDENLPKAQYSGPSEYAEATAIGKALDVYKKISPSPDLIIGSDTVVSVDDEIMEKPSSEGEAFRMLKSLSGRSHEVVTAVALVTRDGKVECFYESTRVHFAKLTNDAISAYIKTGEPMDKAGAYGIQGKGGAFVKEIQGCYYCVMGLPMHELAQEIRGLVVEGRL